ncbi:hypothetical protein F0562_033823 [Nyssa sinensis]|uniref:Glycosyltransferase 61 catalytic domain-containing protein n=1 Tax=Nyssa sinensis TaxID=561372 RepID=A0A5J5AGR7_9ASTE|nr:hypothetical protein F0562_033823 [Nyssa sinensis]
MIVDVTLQRGPRRPKTISDFRAVLSTAFNQGHSPRHQPKSRAQLVLLRRSGTRKIVNEDEVRREAEEVGFDVVVIDPKRETPTREIFKLLDGSHALVGAHSAGLTHVLFMRSASVFMQVVPLRCAWPADICYGKLSIRLGLEYIVYDIQVHESNLGEKLARECLEPHDPGLVMGNLSNWNMYMNQDIKIDLDR